MYALITYVVLIVAYASPILVNQKVLKIAKLLYCKILRIAKLSYCKVLQTTRLLYCKMFECKLKSRKRNFNFKNNFKKSDNFI